jgi:hypothetical protein
MSVDESVLGQGAGGGPHIQSGRPSSMLARVSSSAAVLSGASGKEGKMASTAAAPRRVLGDLSNANKLAEQRVSSGKDGSKDAIVKDAKTVSSTAANTRARSASVLSNKPLGSTKPSVSAAGITTTHSRSTSTASRHSQPTISAKSSQSSLHNLAEPAGISQHGLHHPVHRRSRTQSDNASVLSNATAASSSSANIVASSSSSTSNLVAPGAPKIGSGNWNTAVPSTNSQDTFEELLDTVVEGDSYDGPSSKGLGLSIDADGTKLDEHNADQQQTIPSSQVQDEDMESAVEHPALPSAGDADNDSSSNDTFELDLDQAFNDDELAPPSNAHNAASNASMQIDGKSIIMDNDSTSSSLSSTASTSASAVAAVIPPTTAARTSSTTRKRDPSTASHSRNKASRSANANEIDPDDWLALRETIKRDAEQKILEIRKDYREELDLWDISMVAEYSDEIFEYMEELEVRASFFLFLVLSLPLYFSFAS